MGCPSPRRGDAITASRSLREGRRTTPHPSTLSGVVGLAFDRPLIPRPERVHSLTFTVPPYTVMQGIAQIANGKLTVPFTVTGLLTYSSGAKLQTTGTGTYVGDNCLTAAVFTVDIGYSVITVNVDSSADYSACFCLQILSPSDQSVIYTSAYSSSIEPGGSQSIDLADILHPPANYFFVGGEQTRMHPLVKLSNGTVISGPSVQVYKPSRGNSHVSVYDCYGTLIAPACLFNSNQSG